MNAGTRANYVAFADERLRKSFEKLRKGKSEDMRLYGIINRALDDLKADPFVGIKIPKGLWPKEYVRRYGVDNLWKYDMPDGWRLIYTVKATAVEIVSIVLEWFSHKDYERRFGY
ncbi:MAG: hypothetical protein NT157_02110 [Candidatus Micrarchaeota archaeon]|nr:hypothetical protein [Candidatus Micrarchaeota archaeon]